jgi:hypothetical protein
MYYLLLKIKIMKTNLKRILGAALLMFAVVYVSAVEPVIHFSGNKTIVLKLVDISENTNLAIKDLNGYVFYSESIQKASDSFSKSFDLTTLPNGDYKIEVEGSVKITTYPISIENNKIVTTNVQKTETFKPSLVERGDKVYVSKFNPENNPLEVSIYNERGELVYEETLEGQLELGRIYNFSKAQGTYTLAMHTNDKTYTKTVTIQK